MSDGILIKCQNQLRRGAKNIVPPHFISSKDNRHVSSSAIPFFSISLTAMPHNRFSTSAQNHGCVAAIISRCYTALHVFGATTFLTSKM